MIVEIYESERFLVERVEGRDPYEWYRITVYSFEPIPLTERNRERGLETTLECLKPTYRVYCPPGTKMVQAGATNTTFVKLVAAGCCEPGSILAFAKHGHFHCRLVAEGEAQSRETPQVSPPTPQIVEETPQVAPENTSQPWSPNEFETSYIGWPTPAVVPAPEPDPQPPKMSWDEHNETVAKPTAKPPTKGKSKVATGQTSLF